MYLKFDNIKKKKTQIFTFPLVYDNDHHQQKNVIYLLYILLGTDIDTFIKI